MQPNIKNFIDEVALVASGKDILHLSPNLERTFRSARENFSRDLDRHMPTDPLRCAGYGSQTGSAIVGEAGQHLNKLSILRVTHAFVDALDKAYTEMNAERIAAVGRREGASEEMKSAEPMKWEDWGMRIKDVLWEICAHLAAGMEVWAESAYAELGEQDGEEDYEMMEPPYTSMMPLPSVPSPTEYQAVWENLSGHHMVAQEAPRERYANDESYEVNTPRTSQHITLSTRSARTSANPSNPSKILEQGPGGHENRRFTPHQRKTMLRWMKQNNAYSAQYYVEEFEELLQEPAFIDAEKGQKRPEKLRKRVRDKIGRLRVELLDEGAAEIKKDEKKRKVLVFADWTDRWLENDWDGNIKNTLG